MAEQVAHSDHDAGDPDGAGGSLTQRLLDGIERVGNKVPHPVLMFLYLIGIVIVLSQVLDWADVSVTESIAEPVPIMVQEY
jgi:aminobenzoyl-glutamate transport protein